MNLKSALCVLSGYVYIPEELMKSKGKKLLHISDTPATFYPQLKRLLQKLKPDYIAHTGDLADNIKLEIYPRSLDIYDDSVKHLIKIMENSCAEEIYIALGNHDDLDTVKKYCKRSHIIDTAKNLLIQEHSFNISHYQYNVVESPAEYNLFGHDLSLKTIIEAESVFLNGITSINVIELASGICHCLCYPYGTDDMRLGRRKSGL